MDPNQEHHGLENILSQELHTSSSSSVISKQESVSQEHNTSSSCSVLSKQESGGSRSSSEAATETHHHKQRKWINTLKSKLSHADDSDAMSTEYSVDSHTSGVGKAPVRRNSAESFYDSMSEEDSDVEELVEDWLGEVDLVDSVTTPSLDMDTIKITLDDDFNVPTDDQELVTQLRAISDLQFNNLSQREQLDLISSIGKIEKAPGEVIIAQNDDDDGGFFYLVLGPPDAQVEVVRMVNDAEEFLTRLSAGEYFGEKYFMNNRTIRRNATVRAVTSVILGSVAPEYFPLWQKFRTFLLMKAVPLIRTLPQSDQQEMYAMLQHQEFTDGEAIIRQGDVGDKFYIITDGMADVVEESWDGFHFRRDVLTRLYEGHFFGEMAIIYDEPRVASVIAVGRTSCLYLSKAAFRDALTAQQFHRMMQNVAYERTVVRERREKAHHMTKLNSTATSSTTNTSLMSHASQSHWGGDDDTPPLPPTSPRRNDSDQLSVRSRRRSSDSGLSQSSMRSRSPRASDRSDEDDNEGNVTTTHVLVRRRLSTGDRFINKYMVLKELGRGSFGEVYLCKNEETERLFAMKSITKSAHKWSLNLTDEIKREIAIMKRLRHPNVVSLFEVIDDPTAKQVYLIQEYLEGGPLLPGEEVECKPLPPEKVWLFFRDMLRGVSYLHSQGIVHRDLKPQNMLLTREDQVKIADFGAAVLTGGGAKVLAAGGTPAFMAPELFRLGMDKEEKTRVTMSPQVDVWSLGATLYNMVFGKPPWMAKNQLVLAEKIQNIELQFPSGFGSVDPHLRNLLKRMLEKDPKTRISMMELSWHEWVTKEGSMPLDDEDDFNLAEYDVRDQVSDTIIDEAIPEYNGAIPLRRLSGSMLKLARHTSEDSVAVQALKNQGIAFPISIEKNQSVDSHDSGENVIHAFHYPLSTKPSSEALTTISHTISTPRNAQQMSPCSDHSSSNSQQSGSHFSFGSTTEHVEAMHDEVLHMLEAPMESFDEEEGSTTPHRSLTPPEGDKPKRGLTYTKNQAFVAQPTEMVLTESGELWKGVIITNAKNRSKNSGFNWTSHNKKLDKKVTRKFGRSNTYSSDENHNDSDSEKRLTGKILSSPNVSISSRSFSQLRQTASKDSEMLDLEHILVPDLLPKGSKTSMVASDLSEFSDASSYVSSSSSSSSDDEEEVEILVSPLSGMDRPKSLKLSSLTKSRRSTKGGDESDDEVQLIEGSELDCMLDSLCIPEQSIQNDHQLLPIALDRRGTDSLFHVKTFVGQTNLRLGIRYGMAEIINSRDYQEDRTTAKASVEEEAKRIKDRALSGAPPNSSFHLDYLDKSRTEDFAYFGIYDGHEGAYVSEYLMHHLYLRFRQRLAINGSGDKGVTDSFLEAASLVDEEILQNDFERMKIAKMNRAATETSALSPGSPIKSDSLAVGTGSSKDIIKTQRSLIQEIGTQSFAGSTAVVAILYGGTPYETPTHSQRTSSASATSASIHSKSTPRHSGTSDASSSAASLHSLVQTDSFYGSLQPGKLHVNTAHTEEALPSPNTHRPEVKLFIAHVGDSRAVLSESGIAVQLTMDHSPKNHTEKDRIEAAGGWVQKGRVNGVLGVSRSFGDIMFKQFNPDEKMVSEMEHDLGNVWHESNQVISLPETLELVVHPTYEFVVLASDGLFEKCSCVDVVNFVRRRLIEHGDAQRAATEMAEKVEMQGGSDNTSVLVICLNQLEKPISTASSVTHSSSITSKGTLSPTMSMTEENLKSLRHTSGSWRRMPNRHGISPVNSFTHGTFNDSWRSAGSKKSYGDIADLTEGIEEVEEGDSEDDSDA